MRSWVVAVTMLAAPSAARADGNSFLFAAGGVSAPVADSNWNQSAKPGPALKAGAALHRGVGAMATIELSVVPVSSTASVYPIYASDPTLRRLRVLGHLMYEQPNALESGFALTIHAGIGLDRVYSHYDQLIAGTALPRSATYSGVALELGAATWFDLATGIDLGAVLAVPISTHSAAHLSGDPIGFNYTSFDLELMAAVRFTSGD